MTALTQTKTKVAIYVRKSRQTKSTVEESLSTQKDRLVNIAKSNGYDYEIFQEVAPSQSKLRPEFNKMMEAIEDGEFQRVLVYAKDRLSRSKVIDAEIEEIFRELEVIIETPDKEIDFSDPNQSLLETISTAISAGEYDRTRKRLSDGRFDFVELQNKWLGSRPPLGYDWDRNIKQLIINPKESVIVRKMVELALQGYSSRQIADKLNKLGYRGKLGSPFKTDRILEVLYNRVHLGESKLNSKRKKKVARGYNCHEPLMTEDEYNQIQILFKSRRVGGNYGSLGTKSPLNSLLKCGVCGKGLTIQLNNKGISKISGKNLSFYQIRPCLHYLDEDRLTKCHNRGIKVKVIEEAVLEALKGYKNDIIDALNKLENKDTSDLEQSLIRNLDMLTKVLKKKERGIHKLLEIFLEEMITKDEYTESKSHLEESKLLLQKEIDLVSQKLNNIDTSTQVSNLERVLEMLRRFDEMDLEEQNATLKIVISKIFFTKTPDTNNEALIDIHWREL